MERNQSIPFISSLGSWYRSPLVSPVPRVSSILPFLDPHVTVSQLTSDIFKLFSHAMKLLLGAAARPDAVWISSPTCIELGPGDCISLMGLPTPGYLQKQMCWHLRIPTWEELCANQWLLTGRQRRNKCCSCWLIEMLGVTCFHS